MDFAKPDTVAIMLQNEIPKKLIYFYLSIKKLSFNHWILIFLWIIYYALHSIFAATTVKLFFKNKLKSAYRYYRLSYSIFVTVTLVLLLLFQYSFETPQIFQSSIIKYVSFFLLVLPGLVIMFISIKKYFLLLSGIRSIYEVSPTPELKVEGIHHYMRHPLYSGTILFVWGLFFIFPLLVNLIAVILLTLYVLIGITFEEKKLLAEFGKSYSDYMEKVPMLIPKLT